MPKELNKDAPGAFFMIAEYIVFNAAVLGSCASMTLPRQDVPESANGAQPRAEVAHRYVGRQVISSGLGLFPRWLGAGTVSAMAFG
jgi:hypothetical protein